MSNKSYAFVLPRYFPGLAGGAETLAGNLAIELSKAGYRTEIFTTCAKDNRTWEDFFPEGKIFEHGVTINRFKVDKRDLDVWIPKQIAISQGMRLSVDDQLDWMREGVNSKAMYQEVLARQDEFDAIFFAPYLFASTFWGSMMVKDKAVLIPCLHDECYAYQEVIFSMFRQVRGCLFNAKPEQELAESIYGPILGAEVGMGFEPFEEEYVNSLKANFGFKGPYVLYMGRKETGKNVDLLIDNFIFAKDHLGLNSELKLVIAGGGDFKDLYRDKALLRGDIIDLAHLPEADKHCLMKEALVFCQPSTNESFSIVIMESWLLGVPCLVHADCAVTKYHAKKSGGGLYFSNEIEFAETIRLLMENSELRQDMSTAGAQYVRKEYSWQAVLERFASAMNLISSDELNLHSRI